MSRQSSPSTHERCCGSNVRASLRSSAASKQAGRELERVQHTNLNITKMTQKCDLSTFKVPIHAEKVDSAFQYSFGE